MTALGSTILRKHLDEIPLWRGDAVEIRQLVDDFARYPYLDLKEQPERADEAAAHLRAKLMTWSADT